MACRKDSIFTVTTCGDIQLNPGPPVIPNTTSNYTTPRHTPAAELARAPVGGVERGCTVPDLDGGVSALGLAPCGDAGWDGAALYLEGGVSSLGHLRDQVKLSQEMAQAGGEWCGLRTDCAALPADYRLSGGSEGVQALPECSMRDMHAGDGSLTKLRRGKRVLSLLILKQRGNKNNCFSSRLSTMLK